MPDEALRQLERRWQETSTVEDGALYLRTAMRRGVLSRRRLELVAALGEASAAAALGEPPSGGQAKNSRVGVAGLVAGLARWEASAPVMAARACCEHLARRVSQAVSALRSHASPWALEEARRVLHAARRVFDLIDAWVVSPSPEHALPLEAFRGFGETTLPRPDAQSNVADPLLVVCGVVALKGLVGDVAELVFIGQSPCVPQPFEIPMGPGGYVPSFSPPDPLRTHPPEGSTRQSMAAGRAVWSFAGSLQPPWGVPAPFNDPATYPHAVRVWISDSDLACGAWARVVLQEELVPWALGKELGRCALGVSSLCTRLETLPLESLLALLPVLRPHFDSPRAAEVRARFLQKADHPDPKIRQSILHEVDWGDAKARGVLRGRVLDENETLENRVAGIAKLSSANDAELSPLLHRLVGSRDWNVSRAALLGLKRMEPPSFIRLIKTALARQESPRMRETLCKLVDCSDPGGEEILWRVATSETERVTARSRALKGLPQGARLAQLAVALSSHPSPSLRRSAYSIFLDSPAELVLAAAQRALLSETDSMLIDLLLRVLRLLRAPTSIPVVEAFLRNQRGGRERRDQAETLLRQLRAGGTQIDFCPNDRELLREWGKELRCWTCGWPRKSHRASCPDCQADIPRREGLQPSCPGCGWPPLR
jgi:hypothetical protein